MSGCYWVSRECVWQRLMLNRALRLKIKARLPRRDFDIMINQFKMTTLPLLILLPPNPARIIQPRDLHPANHLLYLGSPAGQSWETGHLYYPRPTSAETVTRQALSRDLFDGILVVAVMAVMALCTELLCWGRTGSGDQMFAVLSCLVLSRMMQMSPGVVLRGSYFKLTVITNNEY